jgi:hypothetical protein
MEIPPCKIKRANQKFYFVKILKIRGNIKKSILRRATVIYENR